MFQRLNGENVNVIALGLIGGMLFTAFRIHSVSLSEPMWNWLLGVATSLSLFVALFNYWRLLKITEAPTSTIAARCARLY